MPVKHLNMVVMITVGKATWNDGFESIVYLEGE